MTVEQVRAFHQAKPFKPFTIHVADGAEYQVQHPENMLQTPAGRTLIVTTGDESFAVLDLLLVTRITSGNGASRRKR